MNKYNFLITTVHEFAHLGCYLKHKNSVMPHGAEWKKIYSDMLKPFIERGIFPNDLNKAVKYHIGNVSASSCTCPKLSKALAVYDKTPGVFVDDIGVGQCFVYRQNEYTIIEKRRTRYLCERKDDDRQFLFSGNAKVLLPTEVLG